MDKCARFSCFSLRLPPWQFTPLWDEDAVCVRSAANHVFCCVRHLHNYGGVQIIAEFCIIERKTRRKIYICNIKLCSLMVRSPPYI